MSIAEKNPQAVDNRRKQRRGKTKGRIVDINALLQVQGLLGNESRVKDLLIEQTDIPFISIRGRKGGSPLAATVVNQLAEIALELKAKG